MRILDGPGAEAPHNAVEIDQMRGEDQNEGDKAPHSLNKRNRNEYKDSKLSKEANFILRRLSEYFGIFFKTPLKGLNNTKWCFFVPSLTLTSVPFLISSSES